MADRTGFAAALRDEYDARLLDPAERAHQAARLYRALSTAGLWRPRARILDVGTGAGWKLAFLGPDAALRVGSDIRRHLYSRVRDRIPALRFVQASATGLPFPSGGFDLVICVSVIAELPAWREAMAEMARCVAPGGMLYVSVTNGRLLRRVYAWSQRLGRRIPESWWHYAQASLPLLRERPEEGLGVEALAGWSYVHLSPYLLRAQWPWLRLPMPLLDHALRRLTPTYGHLWRRPG